MDLSRALPGLAHIKATWDAWYNWFRPRPFLWPDRRENLSIKPPMVATILPDPPRLTPGDYILGNPFDEGSDRVAMPREAVHMICGAPGSGKTTFVFQMIKAMQGGPPGGAGLKFFGYPTRNIPLVYLSMDRTEAQTENTMKRCGLAPDAFPHYRVRLDRPDQSVPDDERTKAVIRAGLKMHPEAKLIIIDGFTMLAAHGRINDYLECACWLQQATDFCSELGIALIGLTHSPKQRGKDKIDDPRGLIMGSTAQGGSVASIIVVEEMSHKDGDHRRRVHFMTRDLAQHSVILDMDENGVMVEQTQVESRTQDEVEMFMCGRADKTFTPSMIVKEIGVPLSTVKRAIEAMKLRGLIIKEKHGHYKVAPNGIVFSTPIVPGPAALAAAIAPAPDEIEEEPPFDDN